MKRRRIFLPGWSHCAGQAKETVQSVCRETPKIPHSLGADPPSCPLLLKMKIVPSGRGTLAITETKATQSMRLGGTAQQGLKVTCMNQRGLEATSLSSVGSNQGEASRPPRTPTALALYKMHHD